MYRTTNKRLQRKRIKGQLVLKFLVALVLGLALYGTTALVISNIFRLSDAALDSFGKLTDMINEMKDKARGEIDSTALYMDKDTMIVFFNKGVDILIAKNIGIFYSIETFTGLDKYIPSGTIYMLGSGPIIKLITPEGVFLPSTAYIKRPSSCSKDQNCICLIREFEKSHGFPEITDITFDYSEIVCQEIALTILYTNKGKSTPLIYRSKTLRGGEQARERAIFLEKGAGDFFGFCEESPCLTITSGDVHADTAGLSFDQFISQLLDKSYSLLTIARGDSKIVQETASCGSPKTNPVQIIFSDNNDGAVDFIWDAKQNKAFARDKTKDQLYEAADILGTRNKGNPDVFSQVAADWEYNQVILPILKAESFEDFYSIITDKINWDDPCLGECLFLVDGDANLDQTTAEFVKNKITKNRPDYISAWIEPGDCKKSQAAHTCNFFEQQGKCNIKEGNICIENTEEICGKTCFCPSDYKAGDIFTFNIGDQEWEFTITQEKTIDKKCIYNCPQ